MLFRMTESANVTDWQLKIGRLSKKYSRINFMSYYKMDCESLSSKDFHNHNKCTHFFSFSISEGQQSML
jgi:hypothetical protein